MAPTTRSLPTYDVGASAGAGALVEDHAAPRHFHFDERWLRDLARDPKRLTMIRVRGDSMEPTLMNGDDIMVERLDPGSAVADGIHVVRIDGALLVKRLRPGAAGRIAVLSDNPAAESFPALPRDAVEVIGRVLWVARRL